MENLLVYTFPSKKQGIFYTFPKITIHFLFKRKLLCISFLLRRKEISSSTKKSLIKRNPIGRVSSQVFPVLPDLSSEVNIAITPIIAPIITHPNKILPNIIDCFKILVKVAVFYMHNK